MVQLADSRRTGGGQTGIFEQPPSARYRATNCDQMEGGGRGGGDDGRAEGAESGNRWLRLNQRLSQAVAGRSGGRGGNLSRSRIRLLSSGVLVDASKVRA